MKKYIASIIFIFALSGCASLSWRSAVSDWSHDNLSGGVRRIVETNRDLLDYNNPDTAGAYDSYTEIRYNTSGNMTLMEVRQGTGGQYVTRDEYEYDPTGRKITKSLSFKTKERTYKEYFYEYDRRGRILQESDTHGSYTIYHKYNCRNKIKETKTVYEQPDKDGEPVINVIKYVYSKGKLKSVAEGSRSRSYIYDNNGALTEIVHSDGQREIFDIRGNLVEFIQQVIIEPQESEEGYVIQTSIKAEYEYDERGNWIKRTRYYEGRAISETVRDMEYY